jgi:predicted nucleotidyltransferase
MVFHRVLDVVFSTWSHIAVLRVLQDSAVGMTGREIARLAGMNHRSCLRALTTLEEIAVVNRQMGGRDHLFSLNREHLLVAEGVLPLLRLERSFLDRVSDHLKKKMGRAAQSMILFGSVARKAETTHSDLDVCFVLRNGQERETVLEGIDGMSQTIRRRFGASLSPFIITASDFRRRAKLKKPPVDNVLKDGVVIAGKSMRELLRG